MYLGGGGWELEGFERGGECDEQAVSKWPESEELVLNLVQVLEELGCLEEAERACTQFCERAPEGKQAWFRLGYLQFRRDMAGAAAESFDRALQLQPVWPEAEVNLALACYRDGQLERAEDVVTKLLASQPQNL